MASKLTGYEIDTIKESDYREMISEEEIDDIDIVEVKEINPSIIKKLIANGYETVNEILEAGKESILEIKGIGSKTVDKIFEIIDTYFEE